MCGATVTTGAARCRTCGADLTRAGVVLSTITPISRPVARRRTARPLIVGVVALVVVVGLISMSTASSRIPVLREINASATGTLHRVVAWGKTLRQPHSATAQQGAPPASAVPVEDAISTASVTILSDPTGAKVMVDAAAAGTTPLTMSNLTPGQHQVRLQRSGYLPMSRTLTLASGETVTLNLTLNPTVRTAKRPTPTTTAVTRPATARKPLEIGARAPHFSLKDRIGIIYRLRDLRGQRVAVFFVWNLDSHARRMIKELDAASRREAQYTPVVIALIPDRLAIRNFVTAEQIRVPILFGDDRMAELYGVSNGVPVLYVLSEQGIIMRRQMGTGQLTASFP